MLESSATRPKVAVLYNFFPHYRSGIIRGLSESNSIDYAFYGDLVDVQGIKPMTRDQFGNFHRLPYVELGPFMWQRGAIAFAWSGDADAIIFFAGPYYLSTWVAAAVARARGRKVLIWAHGWLQQKPPLVRLLRQSFFRLAHRVLVYTERARAIALAEGFDADRVVTVYNCLDDYRVLPMREALGRDAPAIAAEVRARFEHGERPLVICTARLTPECRFELLIEAARRLKARGMPVNLLLVGEGPVRPRLTQAARDAGVDVLFFGACYDEAVLGRLLQSADVTVSPGKIGLTAIHSMTYGTPAISHDNLDAQMPEVEAIVPGVSGALFRENDAGSLADTIASWLQRAVDREAIRRQCYDVVDRLWTVANQQRCIEAALRSVGIGR